MPEAATRCMVLRFREIYWCGFITIEAALLKIPRQISQSSGQNGFLPPWWSSLWWRQGPGVLTKALRAEITAHCGCWDINSQFSPDPQSGGANEHPTCLSGRSRDSWRPNVCEAAEPSWLADRLRDQWDFQPWSHTTALVFVRISIFSRDKTFRAPLFLPRDCG